MRGLSVMKQAERRDYPRYKHEVEVEVVGVMGLYPTSGVTLHISRSGAKIRLNESACSRVRGEKCALHFPNAGPEMSPHFATGVVLGVEEAGEHCVVTIQFTAPLRVLDVDDEVSGPSRPVS